MSHDTPDDDEARLIFYLTPKESDAWPLNQRMRDDIERDAAEVATRLRRPVSVCVHDYDPKVNNPHLLILDEKGERIEEEDDFDAAADLLRRSILFERREIDRDEHDHAPAGDIAKRWQDLGLRHHDEEDSKTFADSERHLNQARRLGVVHGQTGVTNDPTPTPQDFQWLQEQTDGRIDIRDPKVRAAFREGMRIGVREGVRRD